MSDFRKRKVPHSLIYFYFAFKFPLHFFKSMLVQVFTHTCSKMLSNNAGNDHTYRSTAWSRGGGGRRSALTLGSWFIRQGLVTSMQLQQPGNHYRLPAQPFSAPQFQSTNQLRIKTSTFLGMAPAISPTQFSWIL